MKYILGLCQGRHDIPDVETYIFPSRVDPADIEGMHSNAWEVIPADADEVTVYVTGLTAAMMAVVRVCFQRQIGLTAMHYNTETGKYISQKILGYTTCGFCGGRMSEFDLACPHCGAT